MGDQDRRELNRLGAPFWIGLVLGWAVILYGVRGALNDARSVMPFDWAVWIVGANLVHDLVLVPLICGVGVVLAHLVRGRWRAPLQAGIIASGITIAIAWIPLRGYGKRPGNPSALPLNYTTGTRTVLAMVWGVVAIWIVLSRLRDRRSVSS